MHVNLYQSLFWPALQYLDPEMAHDYTLTLLEQAQGWSFGRQALRYIAGDIPVEPIVVAGLTFPNVLGVAAGFDKDVRVVEGLGELGFGHIEVGTLTPRPQKGNSKPRVFRLKEDEALINRLGFPNCGVQAAVPRLKRLAQKDRDYVLGVSLGKQKESRLENASADYVEVMEHVYPYADYLAVNVSSPNTPGLRELQGGKYVGNLLATLQSASSRLARQKGITQRPLFLKIAPDLTWDELDELLFAAQTASINGIIATNTTTTRDDLQSPNRREKGGLSGKPLRQRSTELIAAINDRTEGSIPIIAVGGVSSASDVTEKTKAGAVLVQLYTGLIYQGPAIAGRILRELDSN